MKIGNIVTDDVISVGNEFNVVKSLDNIINGLPTLIIGHSIVKETFKIDLDFIDRNIDGMFWTFSKKEMKKHHIIDLNNFINHCYGELVNNIHYIFIDPIQYSKGKIRKIINKILKLDNIITFNYDDKMLYIFDDNLLFGIDLELIKFIGLDDVKIKDKIISISKTFLGGDKILIEYNNELERLDDQVKFIPILYSINKNE